MPQPSERGRTKRRAHAGLIRPLCGEQQPDLTEGSADDLGNLYPQDLDAALRALNQIRGGVLIQLSTYSADGGNPQGAVIASTNANSW